MSCFAFFASREADLSFLVFFLGDASEEDDFDEEEDEDSLSSSEDESEEDEEDEDEDEESLPSLREASSSYSFSICSRRLEMLRFISSTSESSFFRVRLRSPSVITVLGPLSWLRACCRCAYLRIGQINYTTLTGLRTVRFRGARHSERY